MKELKKKFKELLWEQDYDILPKATQININADDGAVFGEVIEALDVELEDYHDDTITLVVIATRTNLVPGYHKCTDCEEPYPDEELIPNKYEPGQKLCDSCATNRGL